MTATDPSAGLAVSPPALDRRAEAITERELAVYRERTKASQVASARARKVLPLGVPSSIQFFDPHPIVVQHSAGSRMTDVDGNEYVDYDMGFGALLAGHMHPAVRRAVEAQLEHGTLFVTPCEMNATVAELLAERYGQPMWRFTNSGTEATMDAIRVAKAATGRYTIVKVEGGYHGHHDDVMISMKPSIDEAGPADAPVSIASSEGVGPGIVATTKVVPYNDLAALERILAGGDIAAFIIEPVMENIGICLPDDGYLQGVRDLTSRHGTVLIFDEVKTGITAGYGGATAFYGVQPDLTTLAKSIGGGFPIGAFGGRQELMDLITAGRVAHYGTYNGNPLVMAACHATLSEACAREPVEAAIARNTRLVTACQHVIDEHRLPAHTVQFGAKGCITWSTSRVRNYRDYKATNFTLAYAQWIHGINRGVLLPPGLDEQWLISVLHDEADTMLYADVFADFAADLTAP